MAVKIRFKHFYDCDTEAERDLSWGADSLIYTLDTDKYWKIYAGGFVEVPKDEVIFASPIPLSKVAISGVPSGTKYLRDDGSWAESSGGAVWGGLTGNIEDQLDLMAKFWKTDGLSSLTAATTIAQGTNTIDFTGSGDIHLNSDSSFTKKILFGSTNTYLTYPTTSILDIYTGGSFAVRFSAAGNIPLRSGPNTGFQFYSSQAANPTGAQWTWPDDTNTGITKPAADQMGLMAGGVERFLLSTTARFTVDVSNGFILTNTAADRTLTINHAGSNPSMTMVGGNSFDIFHSTATVRIGNSGNEIGFLFGKFSGNYYATVATPFETAPTSTATQASSRQFALKAMTWNGTNADSRYFVLRTLASTTVNDTTEFQLSHTTDPNYYSYIGTSVTGIYMRIDQTGRVMFSNDGTETFSSGTKLDVRGIGGGNAFRIGDSGTNAQRFLVTDAGVLTIGDGSTFYRRYTSNVVLNFKSTTTGDNFQWSSYSASGSSVSNNYNTISGTINSSFQTAHQNFGTFTGLGSGYASWVLFNPAISISSSRTGDFSIGTFATGTLTTIENADNLNLLRLSTFFRGDVLTEYNPQTGSGNLSAIKIDPIYNTHATTWSGVIAGIRYTPTVTEIGVGTHYFLYATSGIINFADPATDTTITTSTILVRNASGDIEKIVAPGTSTGRFLKDDFTWDSPAGAATTFTALTDTPANYTGSGGYLVRVNATPDALEFVDGTTLFASTSHTHTLSDLSDVPAEPTGGADNYYLNWADTGDSFSWVALNTAFNLNLGTSAGTVSEGNHTHTFAEITSKPTTIAGYGITDAVEELVDLSDVVSATNTNRFVLVANGTTGYVGRVLVEADISDLQSYSLTSHNHTLDSLSNVTITANTSGEILKWNGSAWINNTLAEAGIQAAGTYVTSVSGTTNRITSSGGTAPVIDIAATYVGQTSITTLGTIGTGVWQGTAIATGFIAATLTGKALTGVTTLSLDDTDSAFNLVIQSTSTITTADKTLTIDVNDGNRTLTIGASTTLSGGTHSGTNTGDQTSIVGITGTKAQFDTAATDGDFMWVGDAPTAHTLDSHSNVTITAIASGEILKWSGTAWINNTLAEAGIGDVSSIEGTSVDGEVAVFDGTTGKVIQRAVGSAKFPVLALTATTFGVNEIPYASAVGNAVASSASFTFDGTSLTIGTGVATTVVEGTTITNATVLRNDNAASYGDYTSIKVATNTNGARWGTYKARAGSTAVADTDRVGEFSFFGHDGTDYNYSARFAAVVEGAVSANVVPMALSFATSSTQSTGLVEKLRIGSAANTTITGTATTVLFNTVTTNLSIGSAATTARLGASTGTLTLGNATVVGLAATQVLYNTVATNMSFAGAATVLTIGATSGTVNLRNTTVTMSGATAVNVNGASPTLASTSTGTLTLFNTNLLTVNAFGAATSVTLGATTGTMNLRNATIVLTQTPATDAGFATSTMLVRDSSGNLDKIVASGGGTTNFLRADGTWAAPSGGSPGGSTNELQKNDGASGFAGANLLVTDTGNIVDILADDGTANVTLRLLSKGTGVVNIGAAAAPSVILDGGGTNLYNRDSASKTTIYSWVGGVGTISTGLIVRAMSGFGYSIGHGSQINLETETAAANYEIGGAITSVSTNIGSGTEAFDLLLKTMSGGTAATERLRIKSTGQLQLANYTASGSFSGTPVGYLQFDSSGNIITAAVPSGGASQLSDLSDVVSATNTNRFVLVANGTTGYVGRALVEADISDLQTYYLASNPSGYTSNTGTIGGSIANTQVAVGSGADTISGSANYTFSDGIVTQTGSVARLEITSSTGTNQVYTRYINTGGSFYVGTDSSTGGWLGTGVAYAAGFYTESKPFYWLPGGTTRMHLATNGALTLTGNSASVYILTMTSGTGGEHINFKRGTGNAYIFQDNNVNNLYITAASGINLNYGGATGGSFSDVNIGSTYAPWSASNRSAIHINGIGSALLGFTTNGSTRGYIYHDGSIMYYHAEAGTHNFTSSGDEIIRLQTSSASGNPYVGWYQSSSRRAYIQYYDSTPSLEINAEESGSSVNIYAANTRGISVSQGGRTVDLGLGGGVNGRGMVAGYHGTAYPSIGYNLSFGGSTITAPIADNMSYIYFGSGGFLFYGDNSTTAARNVTPGTAPKLATLTNTGAFSLDVATTGIGTAVNWVKTSDRRRKENIKPYGSVLGKARLLKDSLTHFNWIGDDRVNLGHIAQEVLPIFPELIYTNDEGFYSLSSLDGVALQVALEVDDEVTKLKKRVTELETILEEHGIRNRDI